MSEAQGNAGIRSHLRLAVFDLDGTLKEAHSPWWRLHQALGVDDRAAVYRARFSSGEIDYLEWARLDGSLWKGTPLATVEAIFRSSPYRPGVREVFALLRQHGVRSAIVSSGLDVQARQVAAELGVWRVVTNEVVVRAGRLTGEVAVHVTEDSKGQAMAQLRAEAGARVEECLAVGDGPADVDLFAQAGLAIAVCPRDERVRRAAHAVIEDGDLSAVIPLLRERFQLKPT
jgi:phosphoserine phosphatase